MRIPARNITVDAIPKMRLDFLAKHMISRNCDWDDSSACQGLGDHIESWGIVLGWIRHDFFSERDSLCACKSHNNVVDSL